MMKGATPSASGSMPEHDMGHGGVAAMRHFVDLARIDAALSTDGLGELVERLVGQLGQPLECPNVHHDGADARDHVGAEGLLLVEHRVHRDGRAGREVEQRRDDRRRAEVEGDGEVAFGGVAGLHRDQDVIDDNGGHLVVVRAQHRAE